MLLVGPMQWLAKLTIKLLLIYNLLMRAGYCSVMGIAVPCEKITKQFGLVALMIRRCSILVRTLMLFLLAYSTAWAQTLVVQGSTTFTHDVMEPYQKAIEASSGQKLTVVPNRSSLGLLALLEKSADFAMISGPLEDEVKQLKLTKPNLPFDQLRDFNILNTRMAFAINRENPVHAITADNMRDILLGKISNWSASADPICRSKSCTSEKAMAFWPRLSASY
jgi:ABC-type phosphate transport system substrate-binding protein